jgi:hypothetical protein
VTKPLPHVANAHFIGHFLFLTAHRTATGGSILLPACFPEGQMDRFEWDPKLTGFGKRIRDGRETWVIQYRLGHKQRRMTIGACAKLTQAQAREAARKRLAQVELGSDPAADKRQTRTEAKHTLRGVIAQYLEAKQDVIRPATYREVCRYLNDHWSPLHSVPVNAVRRADVALELGKMVRRNGNAAAGRARIALSAFYVWCMGEGIAEANPVIGSNQPIPWPRSGALPATMITGASCGCLSCPAAGARRSAGSVGSRSIGRSR